MKDLDLPLLFFLAGCLPVTKKYKQLSCKKEKEIRLSHFRGDQYRLGRHVAAQCSQQPSLGPWVVRCTDLVFSQLALSLDSLTCTMLFLQERSGSRGPVRSTCPGPGTTLGPSHHRTPLWGVKLHCEA